MKWDKYNGSFYECKRLSDGRRALIMFMIDFNKNNSRYIRVIFVATKKRNIISSIIGGFQRYIPREFSSKKGTGDSYEAYIWAYKKLEEFIETKMKPCDTLIVNWYESKRGRIYRHFLKRLGFRESKIQGEKCMVYRTHKKHTKTM